MNRHIFFAAWDTRGIRVVLVICTVFLFAAGSLAQDAPEMITVQGLGYPPIKAESPAQAHLMAKRAAVVDAYRNSLAAKTAQGQGSDIQYQELSGFVSGMTIIREEYLKDGGIRITANVPSNAIVPSAGPERRRADSGGGPQAVTLDEWYSIVNRLVRYENNQNGGQHEKNH